MNRISAVTWLHFFPDQRIAATKWHGATRADIRLEQPLPPDTVIVVEIAAGMRDAHKVPNRRGRRFPIATADSIPTGRISGVLVMADSAVTNGVVELYAVPPDTLEYFEQGILRRTVTDRTGAFRFDWLPVPGGPWLLRAYSDKNGDLRPGDKEAQRLLPDTLSLDQAHRAVAAGVATLYPPDTPGRFVIGPFTRAICPGPMMAWSQPITEADSGWVPAPVAQGNFAFLQPDTVSVVAGAKPGINRLIVFADVDRDSTFSGVPDSLFGLPSLQALGVNPNSVAGHYLEPWLLVEDLEIKPGLDTPIGLSETAFTLTPWEPPVAETIPDSLPDASPAGSDLTTTDADPREEP